MRTWKLQRGEWAQLSGAILILLWRLAYSPLSTAWKDWLLVFALYWAASIFCQKARCWNAVTVATILYLASIYIIGQAPHVARIWA